MTGNSRPFRDGHDRPLYGKQFFDMEFICRPISAGHDWPLYGDEYGVMTFGNCQ